MSTRFIPGEQLAAALPWQFGALDARRTIKGVSGSGRPGGSSMMRDEAGEALDRVRDEGFRLGLEVGRKQGHSDGLAQAARRNAEFDAILTGMKQGVASLDDAIAADVLKLALTIARQTLCAHIEVDAAAILPVLRDALHSVVAIVQHPRLVLNPADADIVERDMAQELVAHNCRVHRDPRIARGGLRIDDAAFELDATLETRWKRIVASLGMNDELHGSCGQHA